MTYVAVKQAESGVEIQSDAPRERSKSQVTTFTTLGEVDMGEHFGNVDTSHGFIEALYQYCHKRHAEALSDGRARQ